jgi:hypothetical protein
VEHLPHKPAAPLRGARVGTEPTNESGPGSRLCGLYSDAMAVFGRNVVAVTAMMRDVPVMMAMW